MSFHLLIIISFVTFLLLNSIFIVFAMACTLTIN